MSSSLSPKKESVKAAIEWAVQSLLAAGSAFLATTSLRGLGFSTNGLVIPILLLVASVGLAIYVLRVRSLARLKGIRSVSIGGYKADLQFLARSQRIDMLAVTLSNFSPFAVTVQEALSKGARVRIVVQHPDAMAGFAESNSRFGMTVETLRAELSQTLASLRSIKAKLEKGNDDKPKRDRVDFSSSVQVRYTSGLTLRGLIVTDRNIRYWPYLESRLPNMSPYYSVKVDSPLGHVLAEEFEEIWERASTLNL